MLEFIATDTQISSAKLTEKLRIRVATYFDLRIDGVMRAFAMQK
jgi:N-acetylglutamate synthase/N-acetylornithine aminotransferase